LKFLGCQSSVNAHYLKVKPIETTFTTFKESYCLILKILCCFIGRLMDGEANYNFVDECPVASGMGELFH
jgi:hypothetical protein